MTGQTKNHVTFAYTGCVIFASKQCQHAFYKFLWMNTNTTSQTIQREWLNFYFSQGLGKSSTIDINSYITERKVILQNE